MANYHQLFPLIILLISIISPAKTTGNHHGPPPPPLTLNYYEKTCPRFHEIVQNVVVPKQSTHPTTAAATLRLFFHDCMVGGCDASVLVASNPYNKAERDQDINESLAGDGFDVVKRVKTALELECPGVVSCADVLAVTTRDLLVQVGGPNFEVKLGRKDGIESKASNVEGKLGRANMTIDKIIQIFESHKYTIREMVVLMGGGHTIGFAHCKEFQSRLFGPKPDPSVHPKLAERLKAMCANSSKDPTVSAFLDPISAGNFDNMIFKNLLNGLGVLGTDQAMASDPRTRPFVEEYARDSNAFFKDFARAMEKTSVYQVKTGNQGEIRRRCDAFNNLPTGNVA
ncbi:peroxidase 41-like [Rutidosis leptorrhynchoides]|uniref:peroxidase 41-like n=1 Tax=Rutidosis leptorrhynchoides TaxID=125765 RepID=UPI003A995FB3